jgi:hypothetical protein
VPEFGQEFFLRNYSSLANEMRRAAGVVGRPKYIFSIHLPGRREENPAFSNQ